MLNTRFFRFRIAFAAIAALTAISLAACITEGDGGTSTPDRSGTPSATGSPTRQAGTSTPQGQTTPGAGMIDCEAIADLGIPGTTVETQASEEPTSQFAEDISNYFEEAIDNALSDATATCFLEGTAGDNTGLWVSFQLEDELPAQAAEDLRAELESNADPGTTVRAVSVNIAGNEFSAVTVTGAEELGDYSQSGATLLMTPLGVVLIAGTTDMGAPQ